MPRVWVGEALGDSSATVGMTKWGGRNDTFHSCHPEPAGGSPTVFPEFESGMHRRIPPLSFYDFILNYEYLHSEPGLTGCYNLKHFSYIFVPKEMNCNAKILTSC